MKPRKIKKQRGMSCFNWCSSSCCGGGKEDFPPEMKQLSVLQRGTSSSSIAVKNNLYYKSEGALELGDVYRFEIQYEPGKDNSTLEEDSNGQFLWIKVRNIENNLFRPIYLTGPFAFYVDITPHNYKNNELFDEKIQYNPDIKPGSAFKGKLYVNKNSLVKEGLYCWTVDVVSQITLTVGFEIKLLVLIGLDYKLLRKSLYEKDISGKEGVLTVERLDTKTLCNQPPKHPDKPVHLVVTTHGIFSNIGADMLYLRDQIENKVKDNDDANVIVRGFSGNIGKSGKGIKYLGKRVGDYILELYDHSGYDIDRVSFIGHSLGGPVQAYAIFHIVSQRPTFFQKVIPINLITLASPMLGVLSDVPLAVSIALDFGFLGKTGKDLTLTHKFPSIVKTHQKSINGEDKEHTRLSLKPILEQLLMKTVHGIYESFLRRTTYANAINDGIVPLGTSALLYLDWKSLGQVSFLKKNNDAGHNEASSNDKSQFETIVEANNEESYTSDRTPKESSTDTSIETNTTPVVTPIEKKSHKLPSSSDNLVLKNITTTFNSIDSVASLNTLRKKSRKFRNKRYLRTQTVHTTRSSQTRINSESTTPAPISPTPELPFPSTQIVHGPVEMVSSELENKEEKDDDMHIPPVASTVLSAANAVLSPTPKPDYLVDPDERPETIFHDKVYKFSDLPEPHYLANHPKHLIGVFSSKNKKELQEKLARSWHSGMDWRKVLVTLKPDAHNNIIVRRKYVNAWGWGVIEHLVDKHFSEEAIRADDIFVKTVRAKQAK